MLPEWIRMNEAALWWMGAVSILTFFGTLIVIPILVVRIPTDYFMQQQQSYLSIRDRFFIPRLCLVALKNTLGFIFLLAGIAMLVLPGQGVLTMLLGIMLMDFPGKRALELGIVKQPIVLRGINWMRTRAGHPELLIARPNATASGLSDV